MSYPSPRSLARRNAPTWLEWILSFATARGMGTFAALLLMACVGIYGSMLGGEYAAFTASEGSIPDVAARMLGFNVKSVTITGAHELSDKQILDIIGIGPKNSLLFLDVGRLRDKLKALALVKDASVSKLYPNRLLVDIEERKPCALWQRDGAIEIVAADGTPIDTLHNAHFDSLPFVVGDGANARIGEYLALLDVAGDLRPRIKAGILVAQRRWTFKMANGVEVALPEMGAAAAVAELVALQHDYGVLDKDIVSLDLRFHGRLIARLTDAAAQARAALLPHKPKAKGART